VGWWLKRVYWTDEREDAGYWRRVGLITDPPGRLSKQLKGRQGPRIGEERPRYGPQYEEGDLLLVCIAGSPGCPPELVRRCPAILEVTGVPRWDPDSVDDGGPRPKEGDQWGMVTEVSCLHAVDPHAAPLIERIGMTSLNRAPRSKLDDALGERARRLLEQIERRSPANGDTGLDAPDPGSVATMPIEQGEVEGYDVKTRDDVKRAERRERLLVDAYASYMRARGDSIVRQKMKIEDDDSYIVNDAFNESRRQLIEAKADVSRASVRMAIGQLADYRRFVDEDVSLAVLLGSRPCSDLHELLHTQRIAVIWREDDRFADDAGGKFT